MADENTPATTTTKAPRKKFCTKVYLDEDGKESRHASPNVATLEFRFTNDNVVSINLKAIGKGCAKAAAWHGVAQKIGDSYNKAETPDDAQEAAEIMLERLMSDEWVKAGEGAGPKTGVLVQAVVNALTKSGEEVNSEREAGIKAKVSTKEGREGAMANAAINAEYKALQAEAAATRAAKAAKAAVESDATLEGF